MKNKNKQPKPTRAELERKLTEALAGQAHVYHFAGKGLDKASTEHLAGSGIVLTMTVLGGRELFSPVLVRDGLSPELIEALKKDLSRSYNLATLFKPQGWHNED
jgi:hypothetical protein